MKTTQVFKTLKPPLQTKTKKKKKNIRKLPPLPLVVKVVSCRSRKMKFKIILKKFKLIKQKQIMYYANKTLTI